MYGAYPRLFEPALIGGRPNPRHLARDAYLALAQAAAARVARANGARKVTVRFPDGATFAPVRIHVGVRDEFEVRRNDARRRVVVRVGEHVIVYAPQGALVITDLASNINRMMRIMKEIDTPGTGEKLWILTEGDRSATTLLLPQEY